VIFFSAAASLPRYLRAPQGPFDGLRGPHGYRGRYSSPCLGVVVLDYEVGVYCAALVPDGD